MTTRHCVQNRFTFWKKIFQKRALIWVMHFISIETVCTVDLDHMPSILSPFKSHMHHVNPIRHLYLFKEVQEKDHRWPGMPTPLCAHGPHCHIWKVLLCPTPRFDRLSTPHISRSTQSVEHTAQSWGCEGHSDGPEDLAQLYIQHDKIHHGAME